MKIISHRGAAGLAPENSLQAVRISRTLDVDAVEIDIRLTKDKKLVVFHDKTLMRLAGKKRSIGSMTLAEIQKIKLKDGSKIPTLKEVFKESKDMPLVVEGKEEGWARPLLKELKSYKYVKTITVISFEHFELAEFHKLSPKIPTFALSIYGMDAVKAAKEYDFTGVGIFYPALFNPLVGYQIKKHKLQLSTFTINNPVLANLLNNIYPGIWITTNSPHILKKQVKPISK